MDNYQLSIKTYPNPHNPNLSYSIYSAMGSDQSSASVPYCDLSSVINNSLYLYWWAYLLFFFIFPREMKSGGKRRLLHTIPSPQGWINKMYSTWSSPVKKPASAIAIFYVYENTKNSSCVLYATLYSNSFDIFFSRHTLPFKLHILHTLIV